jgi:ABC-type sugar transport system permease subunit
MATTTLTNTQRRQQDRRVALKQAKRNAWAYAFISPFYLLYAVFGLFPLLYGLWLSLHKWDGISPMKWVGAANYIRLLTDDIWWQAIYNTIWLFVGATIPQLIIALALAFIINTPYVKGKDFFRAAFFAPNVAAAVAVSLIFTSLLGARYGMLNYALGFFGLGPIDWLGSAAWLKPSIAMVTIWQWTGYSMIIFLAGLQSINPELYEAARVDGSVDRRVSITVTAADIRVDGSGQRVRVI